MSAVRKIDHEIESASAALRQLQQLVNQFKEAFGFVRHINGPADYEKATAMLHELTSRELTNEYEEELLNELSETLLRYEQHSEQFASFNAHWERPVAPQERLRNLMESAGLTGSDLPEIGDKTVVSKVLSGNRRISERMAFALAKRFHMNPTAFLDSKPLPNRDHIRAG